MSANGAQAHGAPDNNQRSIKNIAANLGGYGINAQILEDDVLAIRENDTVSVNLRRKGMDFLEEQGFERDEAWTRDRDWGAVYRR